MKITFSGFPWQYVSDHWSHDMTKTTGQKWGWNPFSVKGMGRFGGGWAFKLGLILSKDLKHIILDLGIGSIQIKLRNKK
jgi:hypothetical protein